MEYTEARNRLLSHGNLGGAELPADECLWHALRDSRTPIDRIAELARDVVRCLEAANQELNGIVPSEFLDRQRPEVIDDLAPAVSGILTAALLRSARSGDQGHEFSRATLPVALAWQFVLDGDIDEIESGVDLELRRI